MTARYLTPSQVSEQFGGRIAVRTLVNWRSLGTGPKFLKLGGRVVYPQHELEAWETKATVQSTSGYNK